MHDDIECAIEVLQRAANGSAAVYRLPIQTLINAIQALDELVSQRRAAATSLPAAEVLPDSQLRAYQDTACLAALEQTLAAFLENEDATLQQGQGFALEQALRLLRQRHFLAPAAEATVAAAGSGVRLLPAENGPGSALHHEYLYVLLPDNSVTMASWADVDDDEPGGWAWVSWADTGYLEPLPAQPTHYFTRPVAPGLPC